MSRAVKAYQPRLITRNGSKKNIFLKQAAMGNAKSKAKKEGLKVKEPKGTVSKEEKPAEKPVPAKEEAKKPVETAVDVKEAKKPAETSTKADHKVDAEKPVVESSKAQAAKMFEASIAKKKAAEAEPKPESQAKPSGDRKVSIVENDAMNALDQTLKKKDEANNEYKAILKQLAKGGKDMTELIMSIYLGCILTLC